MIGSLWVSLALTLLVELSVLGVLGVRAKQDFLVAAYANMLTNPVVVWVAQGLFLFYPAGAWGGIAVLEVSAVLTEGFVFKHYLTYQTLSPWAVALVANFISFETGFVLYYFQILH